MKIQLTIFSIALVLMSACDQSKVSKEKDEQIRLLQEKLATYESTESDESSTEEVGYLAESGKKFSKKSGGWITTSQAKGKINAYKDHIGRDPKDPSRIKKGAVYAMSFGIDKMDSLMQETKRINAIKKDSIIGIRVYLNWVKRNTKFGPDVLLVPVKSDFKNLYPIDMGFDPEMVMENDGMKYILNSSVPCPFDCDPD